MTDQATANLLSQYLTLDPSRRRELYSAFRAEINAMSRAGQVEEALAALRQAVSISNDYSTSLALYRLLKKVRTAQESGEKTATKRTKLAILGSYTTMQLTWLIDLFLFGSGIDVEIYEAEYGVLRQEIYNPESELYRFQPIPSIVNPSRSW